MALNIMDRCPCVGSSLAADRAEEAAEAARIAAQRVAEAYDTAAAALAVVREAEKIRDLTAQAQTLESGEPATAGYDRPSNTLTLGIPKGDVGPIGPRGPEGHTPYIDNNTWWINGVDTGVPLAVYNDAPPPSTFLEGGAAASTYLANQRIDGGNAANA